MNSIFWLFKFNLFKANLTEIEIQTVKWPIRVQKVYAIQKSGKLC